MIASSYKSLVATNSSAISEILMHFGQSLPHAMRKAPAKKHISISDVALPLVPNKDLL